MKNSVIYIGWINKGKPADCGETVKNQLCIKKFWRKSKKGHLQK